MSKQYETNNVPEEYSSSEPMEGRVVVIKPTRAKKLARVFFPADVTNVKDFLIWDVFFPNLKMFALKCVNDAFGGTPINWRTTASSPRRSTGSWLDNNVSYAMDGDALPESFNPRRGSSSSVLDDIENLGFYNEEDARKARNDMYFKAKRNGVASLHDLCAVSKFYDPDTKEVIKIEPKWTYQDFGWTLSDIEHADIVFNGTLYFINLPPAKDIKSERKTK